MAKWGVDAIRFRLRGATDEATEELLAEIKEVFQGTSARQIARSALACGSISLSCAGSIISTGTPLATPRS